MIIAVTRAIFKSLGNLSLVGAEYFFILLWILDHFKNIFYNIAANFAIS